MRLSSLVPSAQTNPIQLGWIGSSLEAFEVTGAFEQERVSHSPVLEEYVLDAAQKYHSFVNLPS